VSAHTTRVAAVLAVSLALAACERSSSPNSATTTTAAIGPRVLFVTWDTTRADHVGCYGGKARTPTFDSLAANGVVYDHCYASAPLTLPSHTSMLTGVYPCAHGVRDNAIFDVAPDARLLAEVFKEAGCRTGAFVGAFVLDPKFGLNQGFDVYDSPDTSFEAGHWGVVERPGPEVADAALRFVDQLKEDDRFFLWVHFYDPHLPRNPPADLLGPDVDPYDAEIASCDRELRRILDRLRARGLDRGMVTVVTADHGDSFGEHGEKTHGFFVYDSTMHVPLVISPPPAGTAPGTRVSSFVSNVDVAATLLDRVGLGRAQLPEARTPSLPATDASGDADRALYLECLNGWYARKWAPVRAVLWHGFKYVDLPRAELYSIVDDPRETKNLLAEKPEVQKSLAARLAGLTKENPPLGWEKQAPLRPEDVKRFAQLGYTAGNDDGSAIPPDRPDPKDHIGEVELRDQLIDLMRNATALLGIDGAPHAPCSAEETAQRQQRGLALLRDAKTLLDQVAKLNPDDTMLLWLAPTIELGLGNHAAAAAAFETLATTNPKMSSNHNNLANCYYGLATAALARGDAESARRCFQWARREMEKVAQLEPHSLLASRWLAQFSYNLPQLTNAPDWPAAAFWIDELLKSKVLDEEERALWTSARQRVQKELDRAQAAPRGPKPFSDEELLPEGVRATQPASSGPPKPGANQ
jgi:arylsulfatase A-like enzyme